MTTNVPSSSSSPPASVNATTGNPSRRLLRYDYGESTTNKGKNPDSQDAMYAEKTERRMDPFQMVRDREATVDLDSDTSNTSLSDQHMPGEVFSSSYALYQEEPLGSWDNAAFFMYRRPWLAVSLWGLGASFLSMAAGVVLRRQSNDVVWMWSNVAILFKMSTVASLVYYTSNPPAPRLPEHYIAQLEDEERDMLRRMNAVRQRNADKGERL